MITRRYWPAALLLLAVSLSACSGNHKFNDGDYRPLGDPQSVKRGE
ncbi:MAG: type VI secretion protein [Pseudoalteromonas distincta]|tara:strand:+ start:20108 stop:20245 length:138 start_codon:yes stop_codon:yes gene_type:complete